MSQKHIRWLNEQLPLLVAQNVIPADAAARLKDYYARNQTGSARSIIITLFAILGGALIAGGIITLVAHNWPQFGRPTRALLAFLVVMLGQGVLGYGLWRGKSSAAFLESAGIFAQLTFGAGFALVAQTYHLSDDLGAFILVWMLCTLPLVYLLRATGPALVYLAGITSWAATTNSWQHHGNPVWWWLWLALLIPHAVLVMRRQPYHPRAILLMWGMAIALSIGTCICMDSGWRGLWLVIFTGLAVSMYLAGSFWQGEGTSLWQRPLTFIGGAGATVLAFVMTFSETWEHMGWAGHYGGWWDRPWATIHDASLATLATVTSIALMVTCRRRRQGFRLGLGMLPVIAALGYAVLSGTDHDAVELAFFLGANLYLFGFGIMTLIEGLKLRRLGTVNYGMLVIAALLLARFFNSEISFLAKGIAFILMGCGFLATNLILARKPGGGAA